MDRAPSSRPSRLVASSKSLSRQVADDLIERIGAGEFTPGSRLPTEVDLMGEYGVGRNAVREAVQGLVTLRMVEVRPRRGARVLAATPDQAMPMNALSNLLDTGMVHDLYDVRMLLECRAAELAAGRRVGEELDAIRTALAHFTVAFETGAPVWQADIDFHHAVALASGNVILPRILEAAQGLLISARRKTADVPDAVRNAVHEHAEILSAVERGDTAGAAAAMRLHITHGREAYDLIAESDAGTAAP